MWVMELKDRSAPDVICSLISDTGMEESTLSYGEISVMFRLTQARFQADDYYFMVRHRTIPVGFNVGYF
jgi:hypothetical protein